MGAVMLDVGSRNGESVEEFVRHDFDTIHAFEPMPAQFQNMVHAFADNPVVVLHNCGLSDRKGVFPVYGADDNGEASLFQTKVDIHDTTVTQCRFLEASWFFKTHIADDDDVLMKLNCEGAEVPILHNLMDTGEIRKVRALRVELDISRVIGHEHEADMLIDRMEAQHVNYTIGSDARLVNGGLVDRIVQEGSHHDRLHQWLDSVL